MTGISPRLDYYVGRGVVEIDDTEWAIVLDGDIRITNKDTFLSTPENLSKLVGKMFLVGVMSADETRLQFGRVLSGQVTVEEEIVLSPLDYTISDPRFPTPSEHYPQREELLSPGSDAPPDPSPDRVVDGPVEAVEDP
jgi:hypothetical protein